MSDRGAPFKPFVPEDGYCRCRHRVKLNEDGSNPCRCCNEPVLDLPEDLYDDQSAVDSERLEQIRRILPMFGATQGIVGELLAHVDALTVALAEMRGHLQRASDFTGISAQAYYERYGELDCDPDVFLSAVLATDPPTRGAAILEAAERLCTELEYVWEMESHAARFRQAIDAWRALGVGGQGGTT